MRPSDELKSDRLLEGKERVYRFTTPVQLINDFQRDIARWNNENRNA